MGALTTKVDELFWKRCGIVNRILECDNMRPSTLFLLRIIGFFFVAQTMISTLALYPRRTVLYLTHWAGYITLLGYSLLMLAHLKPRLLQCGFYWKILHLLLEGMFTLGVVVSAVFWLVIGPCILILGIDKSSVFLGKKPQLIDIVVNSELHSFNYICLFIEMCYNRLKPI